MGKYLKIGGEPGGERWTLPDDADVEKIRAEFAAAMEDEKPVRLQVVVGKDQTADLIVNAGEVPAVLVWEDMSRGGMTIID
ncbi:MAG: hypothetical protein ACRDJ1_07765 [Actinomycetota bacterium]|jgi:hypothetical protein